MVRLTLDSDIDLIFDDFCKGDESAFHVMYKYFINDMYAYGMSMGMKEDWVMDAIQDVFLNILTKKPKFESVKHLKFFLFKSLKNKLYDISKSKDIRSTTSLSDDMTFSIKTTVLDNLIEEEDRAIINHKINKLLSVITPMQKEILYLRYIENLDYKEISQLLNKKEANIRKIVSQALLKIRKENNIIPMLLFIELLLNSIK
ncbi:MAG: RNA polymerase sigma factor [Fermentimonas sp.]|jgi:RNA polymerase sigma factor (sigma-70 family)